MNQENLLLLKELLPSISLEEILHAYSSYEAACCIQWVLVVLFTVLSVRVSYKAVDIDEEVNLLVSGLIGIIGFFVSLGALNSITNAIFPLGALISKLAS